jgi:GT2 family glycosyltransferase
LDDDCIPAADALQQLLDAPARRDRRSIVGRLVVSESNSQQLAFPIPLASSYRRLLDWYSQTTTDVEAVRQESNELGYPFGLFFNSVLLPKSAVQEIGVPRGELFIWGDEVEYLYRARAAGFRTYIVVDSLVRHPSASEEIPRWKEAYLTRNKVWIHRQYFRWPRLRLLKNAIRIIVRRRFDLLRALVDGMRGDFSRDYRAALREPEA